MPTDIAVDANKQTWANIEMPILISESRSEWGDMGRKRERKRLDMFILCVVRGY